MASVEINLTCNLQTPVKVQYIDGNMFSLDNAGNTINVLVFNGEEPAELGGSVAVSVIRSDGATVAVSGAISGNKAYAILPQSCYAVPGVVSVVVKNVQNTTVTTLAAFVANVYQTSTETTVDPGTIIPSVSALIAQIEAAVDSVPADYSALLATIAEDYSSSKTYPTVGAYAWCNGALRRSIVPITTAETYNSAHWTDAVIGDDLSALKSASDRYGEVERFENWVKGHYYPNGTNVDTVDINNPSTSTNYSCMVIPCVPGELFEYFGESSNAARSVSFLSSADSSGNKLTTSGYGYTTSGYLVVAPANSQYVVVNRKTAVFCSFVRYNKRHTLQPGDNLTNITAEGTYFCTSAADSALITGGPEGMGALAFRLDVQKVRGVSNYFRQILTTTTTESKYVQIYIRIFTSLVGDWLLVYSGNQNFLDIKNLSLIENGTDMDDILAPGSYYCPNYSSAATLLHLPFFVDSGFSLYVVNSGSVNTESTYIRQIIFANKKEYSSIYTRTKNIVWGEWQIIATADMILSPHTIEHSAFVPGARLTGTPKKTITVATNNVAHYWLQGKATDDFLADHPIKIDDWRKLLMKTNADIIFLQECEDYIDENRTQNAFDVLYKPFFDQDQNIDDEGTSRPDKTGRAHPSRRKILNRLGLDTEGTPVTVEPVDTSYQYDCYFSWCIVTLDGVGELLLIDMHNFAGSSAARATDRKHFLDVLAEFINEKTYDYLIIAGDTNARIAETDYGNILSFCSSVNAIPVNGGVIGWFGTASQEELPYPYDNIIVSNNIRIENIDCDPMLIPSGQLHTDHTLVAAKISFM